MKLIYPSFVFRQNPQTVLKNSLFAIVFSLAIAAMTLLIFLGMAERHRILFPALIYTIATGLFLLTAPQRQTRTGSCLLKLERPPSHEQQFLQAIWGLLITLTVTLLLISLYACFNIAMEPIDNLLFESILTILLFLWMQGFYLLFTGMSQPEFRHKALWMDLRRITWRQIQSYSWKRSKTNRFRLDVKYRFLWLPQRLMLYPISAQQKETIDRILQQKLSLKTTTLNPKKSKVSV